MAVESWQSERIRVAALNELGRMYQRRDLADTAILHGWPVASLQSQIMRELAPDNRPITEIGLTPKEKMQYSVLAGLRWCGTRPEKLDGLEGEGSRAIAAKIGREPMPGGFFVPYEILSRALSTQVASSGGFLVATTRQPASFIEVLRNRSLVRRLGARTLENLQGNTLISKQTGQATGYWLDTEATQAQSSQLSVSELALTPKTVAAHTIQSRQLVMQTSGASEAIVMTDLGATLGVAVDLAAIDGVGHSGQPTGILRTSGIGTVTGATMTYDAALEFQSDLLTANALANTETAGYLTTAAVAKLLATRSRFSNSDTPIWEGNLAQGEVAGFPAYSTQQMPTATMLFGDWSEVVIGEWGILEIGTDPFTNFKTGKIGIRGLYTIDIALRHAASFSAATSIT
jgi:HK97 family phage major capsid protein